jgi:hypothetical protein
MITRAMSQKIKQIEKQYTSDEINSALALLGMRYSQMFTLADVVWLISISKSSLEAKLKSRWIYIFY